MCFGENLQYLRRRAELTQEQLAERLEVTRQSVSKWESGAGFPEMEKLIQIAELFHVDLDTLLRGSVEVSSRADTAGYDAHMNSCSRQIAGGVSLCILGVALAMIVEGIGLADRWSSVSLMLCVLPAVVLFIIGGIRMSDFAQTHPYIEPFYDAQTLEAFRRRYPVYIATGVGLCIGAVLFWMLMEDLRLPAVLSVTGQMPAHQSEGWLSGIGTLFLSAGVGTLVYGLMQCSKYRIEDYNRERQRERSRENYRMETICGVIMMIATIIFLAFLFVSRANGWGRHLIGYVAGGVYSIGGILCGIVSMVMEKAQPEKPVQSEKKDGLE